ncbi:MAG: hypothetical protein QGH95_00075 [Candidatus Nitrosopelagicus sp.]|nr:hypothetical protein [Candidatus Nitrosopelagicus sp.]
MESISRKKHTIEKKPTRSTSYRLPEEILNELQTEAQEKNISENVLVKQILEKHVKWDRIEEVVGMIPVPHGLLKIIGKEMTENQIDDLVEKLYPIIMDSTMFAKGGDDLERTIEMLEDFMRASGLNSDHRVEGQIHHFIIQHGLGMTWSVFIEKLMQKIFASKTSDLELKCQLTDTTVVASIPLGSDFDEHSY